MKPLMHRMTPELEPEKQELQLRQTILKTKEEKRGEKFEKLKEQIKTKTIRKNVEDAKKNPPAKEKVFNIGKTTPLTREEKRELKLEKLSNRVEARSIK